MTSGISLFGLLASRECGLKGFFEAPDADFMKVQAVAVACCQRVDVQMFCGDLVEQLLQFLGVHHLAPSFVDDVPMNALIPSESKLYLHHLRLVF